MGEFRFVHAANLHLDTPFGGIGLTTPAVSTLLRDASLRAWDALVRLTIESRAACLLLAGGLYDDPRPGHRSRLALREGLETLAEHDIPVFIVWGGRDPSNEPSFLSDWPSTVTVFDSSMMSVPLRRAGEHLATIHGASHPTREALRRLRDAIGTTESSGLHVGLLHCVIGSDTPSEPCTQLPMEELRALPVRYWALGHEQGRRTVSEDPWVVYPGTPQARRASVHSGAGGAAVVQVAGGDVRQVSFEPLDVVRFRTVVVDGAALSSREEILRQALDRSRRLRRENDGRALMLDVRLRGRARSLDELSAWLIAELRIRTESWRPFVWWTISGDTTEPEMARSAGIDHGEIGSLLLDRSRALLGAALPRSSFLARELDPLRRIWDAELDLEDTKTLLKEATSLALEELAERAPE